MTLTDEPARLTGKDLAWFNAYWAPAHHAQMMAPTSRLLYTLSNTSTPAARDYH